ncbi:MAG: VOC family protein [Paenisporosarcina sp.]
MDFQLDPQMHLGYVTLRVKALEKQRTFYHDLFGLHILEETKNRLVLSADNVHPLIVLQEEENVVPKPARTTGLYHLALLVPTREDLAHVISQLIQKDVRFDGASDHLFSEAFYLTDPEGNGIEIYRDRPRTEWPRSESGELISASDPIDFKGIMSLQDTNRLWTGFPEGTILGHMHLHVSNIKNAGTFYLELLGLEEITRFHESALFMSVGGYHHHIAANIWQGSGASLPPKNSTGLIEYSLVLSSEKENLKLLSHLIELNVDITQEEKGFSISDPNNARMFFTW